MKPCPFCGGEPYAFSSKFIVSICCSKCGAIGPRKDIDKHVMLVQAQDAARTAWNDALRGKEEKLNDMETTNG